MDNEHLIDAIFDEIKRIWPASGDDHAFEGTFEQYDWLLAHYGLPRKKTIAGSTSSST